jgi:hypothetical protein
MNCSYPRAALTSSAERCLEPWPQTALATLVDLGMSDDKIAKYLAIDEDFVRRLRERESE